MKHPPQNGGRQPCKVFAKFNGNHLLMANIFKLYEYQTFGLLEMHSMCKIWFANNIFILWKRLVYDWRVVENAIFYFLPFPFTKISKDSCQKSYNGIWAFLVICTNATNISDLHIFENETAALLFFFFFFNLHGYAFRVFLNERNMTISLLMIHLQCTCALY